MEHDSSWLIENLPNVTSVTFYAERVEDVQQYAIRYAEHRLKQIGSAFHNDHHWTGVEIKMEATIAQQAERIVVLEASLQKIIDEGNDLAGDPTL